MTSERLNNIMRSIDELRVRNEAVKELRLSAATLADLKRQLGPPTAEFNQAALTLTGIPIVVDSRMPDGVVLPVPTRVRTVEIELPPVSAHVLQALSEETIEAVLPWPRTARTPDEAPGMTLAELLGEIDEVLDERA